MNIDKPADDIDLEIKKMKFVEMLCNNVETEILISTFGFNFVRMFAIKLLPIPKEHSAFHMVNKAKVIYSDLKKMKPKEEYPELWI